MLYRLACRDGKSLAVPSPVTGPFLFLYLLLLPAALRVIA
jgi:hypothetical protein